MSEYLIAHDDHWTVEHAHGSGLLGWLVVAARRQVFELAELTDEESFSLGRWQVRLARALTEELGRPTTYAASFGEAPGHRLHLHVVSLPHEVEEDRRGPGIFGYLQPRERDRVEPADRAALAERLRARLGRHVEE